MIQVFGHAKCKGTRAAIRFFSDRRVPVQSIDILDKGMSKGELESVARVLGIEALYDGKSARAVERGLTHLGPDKARMTSLLLEDPRLFRTPIVRFGKLASVSVDESSWKAYAEAAKKI